MLVPETILLGSRPHEMVEDLRAHLLFVVMKSRASQNMQVGVASAGLCHYRCFLEPDVINHGIVGFFNDTSIGISLLDTLWVDLARHRICCTVLAKLREFIFTLHFCKTGDIVAVVWRGGQTLSCEWLLQCATCLDTPGPPCFLVLLPRGASDPCLH